MDPPSISRPPAVTAVKQEQTPKAFALHEPPLPVPASPPPQPPPPALPIVQKNYWVARNGVEIGEFKPVDFMESVDSGKIRQDDCFWMEGMSEWKRVSELKILEKLQPPPRPTLPPTAAQGVSKRARRTLLILSVGLLLLIGGAAYYFQKSNDVVGRSMDDLVQEFADAFVGMNRQLRALDEKSVFEPYVLSNKTILEAEIRKRIESQRIIEKFRNDLPHALDLFPQKAARYNISDEQRQALMSGFEKSARTFLFRVRRCATS